MSLPTPVSNRLDDYLRAIDLVLPGFVQGLYVVGSAALDDWSRRSDVDALVISEQRPGPEQLAVLAELHTDRTRPFLDLTYLHPDDLATRPADVPPGPFALGGRFFAAGHGPRVAVTWHTLAEHGVTVRGPDVDRLEIHLDRDELAAWATRNLRHYWAARLARSARLPSQFGLHALSGWEVEWTVLGVARSYYTQRERAVISKSAAGRYAAEADGSGGRIVEEALRIRSGTGRRRYLEPFGRRRDLLSFANHLVQDATRSDPTH